MKTSTTLRWIALASFVAGTAILSGCFMADNGSKKDGQANLIITTSVGDVQNLNKKGLGKASTITLSKMVVTMVSSVNTDGVLRDTITAGTQGFSGSVANDQLFSKSYAVKALRSWTVYVKTIDVNGVVIHSDSGLASNVLVGQTKAVTLNLGSKYVMYEALFTVPDSLRSNSGGAAQKLTITEFKLLVDSPIVVRDSVRVGGFLASTINPTVNNYHTVSYDYVRADTLHKVTAQFIGRLEGWTSDTVVFEFTKDSVRVNDTTTHGVAKVVGAAANGAGYVGLAVNIGKVGKVSFDLSTGLAPKTSANKH